MPESTRTREGSTVIYECLSRSRRRYVLHRLHEADQPLALADLAEDVADWETDVARSEIDAETVEGVYVALYHNHVPKLVEAGLVDHDREVRTVKLTDYPQELRTEDQLTAR